MIADRENQAWPTQNRIVPRSPMPPAKSERLDRLLKSFRETDGAGVRHSRAQKQRERCSQKLQGRVS